MTFESTSNDELITLWHKQAREMSYLNAAEGQSWYAEATERQACQSELKAIREEFVARSLELPQGSWLL